MHQVSSVCPLCFFCLVVCSNHDTRTARLYMRINSIADWSRRRPAVLSEVPSGFFLFAAFRVSRGNFERELEEDPWSASPLTILGAMCGRGSPLTASIPGPACSLAGGWRPSGRWQARAGAPACTAPAAAGPRPVVLEVPEQFFKDAHMHTLKGSACVAPARRGGWYGGEADVFRKRSCITHADESCESSCF